MSANAWTEIVKSIENAGKQLDKASMLPVFVKEDPENFYDMERDTENLYEARERLRIANQEVDSALALAVSLYNERAEGDTDELAALAQCARRGREAAWSGSGVLRRLTP